MLLASRNFCRSLPPANLGLGSGIRALPRSTAVRSLASLAILEQKNGRIETSSLSAVTAAQKIGGPIIGLVAGSGIKAATEEASKVKGLDKILLVENGSYDKVRSTSYSHCSCRVQNAR